MTKATQRKQQIKRLYYTLFIVGTLAYLAVSLLGPVDNRYDLSATTTRLLQLSLYIPVVLIWFAAVYGAIHFKIYAEQIKNEKEGDAFQTIASGLFFISFGMIATSVLSAIRGYVESESAIKSLTISDRYLSLILMLFFFWLLYVGSAKLVDQVRYKAADMRRRNLMAMLFLSLSATVYVALFFTNQYRNATPDPNTFTSFYLPDSLLLTTYVIPYVIAWALGTQAIVNFLTYQKKVKGVVYHRVFKKVTIGLSLLLGFSIILSMLSSLVGVFSNSSLGTILGLLYLILLLYGASFVTIAKGAKDLSKLEEV